MATKYSHEDLTERLKSPGWHLVTGKKDNTITGTLEHLLNITHARHLKGEAVGLIEEAETTIELEMFQIRKLWDYLGLPT